MAMAMDVARMLLKDNMDSCPNTFDGNMKLQKLLFFANMIFYAENGYLLFDDPMYAFENGMVIENVRLEYKERYHSLKESSKGFEGGLTEEEEEAVKIAIGIYGNASAKELSDDCHSLEFWRKAYERSFVSGKPMKSKALVKARDMDGELDGIRRAVKAYKRNLASGDKLEMINGVKFVIDGNVALTDELYEKLERFSRIGDEESYTVFNDKETGEAVIY